MDLHSEVYRSAAPGGERALPVRVAFLDDRRGAGATAADRAVQASAAMFLVLLLSGDLAFVAIHLLQLTTPWVESGLYSLGRDRGMAEFFQYTKGLWAVVLLLAIVARTRSAAFGAWALLFGFLVLDDALEIHEALGGAIAVQPPLAGLFELHARGLGELIASAGIGLLLLGAIGWIYVRGSAAFKRATRDLVLLLLALAFFGVVVDLAHMIYALDPALAPVLGVIEDGGEMLVMSVVVWYLFLLHHGRGYFPASLPAALASGLTHAFRR